MSQNRNHRGTCGRDYALPGFIQTCVVFLVVCDALNTEVPPTGCINSSVNVSEQLLQRRVSAATPAHVQHGSLPRAQECVATNPRLALLESSVPKPVLAARTRTAKNIPAPTNRGTANLGQANSLSHDANIVIFRTASLGKTKWETEPSSVLMGNSVFNHDELIHGEDVFHLMQVNEFADNIQGRQDLQPPDVSANGIVLATGSAPSTQGLTTDENDSYLPSQANNNSRRDALELISFLENETSNAVGSFRRSICAVREHLIEVVNKTWQQLNLATTQVSHFEARRASTKYAFALLLGLMLICTMAIFITANGTGVSRNLLPRQSRNEPVSPSRHTKKALRSDSLASNSGHSPPRLPILEPFREKRHVPAQTPEVEASEASMGVPLLCPWLVVPESSECVVTLPFLMYDLAEASMQGSQPRQDLQQSGSESGLCVNTICDMSGKAMFRAAFGKDTGDVMVTPWLTLSGIGIGAIVAVVHQTVDVRHSLTIFDTLKRPFGQLVVGNRFRDNWTYTLKPFQGEQVQFHSSDSNMKCRVVNEAGELLALVEPVGSDASGFQENRHATFGPRVDVGLFLVCLLACDWLHADKIY
eukprot:TRINITY_DN1715_c0_g1_i1.p1 TRINITY_DN1715_c0_g1~~TRINITY_DN1715_c0_g1_i1.p1  ORF type:complete len:590 (+),score=71.57 TRINITY_DN1715_c0_g1_i1:141-1910(+)